MKKAPSVAHSHQLPLSPPVAAAQRLPLAKAAVSRSCDPRPGRLEQCRTSSHLDSRGKGPLQPLKATVPGDPQANHNTTPIHYHSYHTILPHWLFCHLRIECECHCYYNTKLLRLYHRLYYIQRHPAKARHRLPTSTPVRSVTESHWPRGWV